MGRYYTFKILLYFYLVSQSSPLLQRNLKENIFYKVNNDVQNTANKLFELLKLNNNFTSLPKHRLLLSMHAQMKTIAENNYPYYKDARRVSKHQVNNKIKSVLFNLDKLINILVDEKLTPVNTTIDSDNGIKLQLTSFEVPDNEDEAFSFLKEHLNNLDGNYNLDNTLQKIKMEFEKNSLNVKKGRKLKSWKPKNLEDEKKVNLTNSRRVFQGKTARIRRFPFLASIHVINEFVCPGSIINKLLVITAASCLQQVYYENNIEIITVRVGSDYTDRSGILYNVSQIFLHPYYKPETLSNNLAIMKLQEDLRFKHKTKIRRVNYQRLEGDLDSSIENIMIVGWGDNKATGVEQLSYSNLDVYDSQKCIDIYTNEYIDEKNFCAGFKSIGGGACKRDIGAPGIVGNVLVGVVSFGPQACGAVNAPTVFTNLGYYIGWIDAVIQEMPFNYSTTQSIIKKSQIFRVYESDAESSTINNMKLTTTAMTTTSQYPLSIKILTYLLNELIATNSDQNSNEDDVPNNNKLKNIQRIGWSTNSEDTMKNETSNLDTNLENEEIEPSIGEKDENNNYESLSYNNPLNALIRDIGDVIGFNKFLKFSEVYKPIPEMEPKFKNSDTLSRNNTEIELNTGEIVETIVKTSQIDQKYENTHKYGSILYNTKATKDIDTTKSEIDKRNKYIEHDINTQTFILENTNNMEGTHENVYSSVSKTETENNNKMSTEMSYSLKTPKLKQYKFRPTKASVELEYKKDKALNYFQINNDLTNIKRLYQQARHT